MKYLVKLDYSDDKGEHVATAYKLVEEKNTLDVMLNIAFSQALDENKNVYDQGVADGKLDKEITGIYQMDKHGVAIETKPEPHVGVPMGKVE